MVWKVAECACVASALLWMTIQQETRCRSLVVGTTCSYAIFYSFLQLTGAIQPKKGLLKSHADEAEWRSRVLGSINAVILIAGSVLCFSEWPYEPTSEGWSGSDRVWSYPCLFASLFVGYLQWDLCWLTWHRREYTDTSATVHHILFIALTHYVLWGYYYKRPYAWLSAAELSTPFLNVRWFYAASQMKEAKGYFWASLFFAVTFLLTRVLGYSFGIFDMMRSYEYWSFDRGLHACAIAICLGYLLNLFWSVKVINALQKAMRKGNAKCKGQ